MKLKIKWKIRWRKRGRSWAGKEQQAKAITRKNSDEMAKDENHFVVMEFVNISVILCLPPSLLALTLLALLPKEVEQLG